MDSIARTDIGLAFDRTGQGPQLSLKTKKAEATDDDLYRIAHSGRASSKRERVEHSNEARALWIVCGRAVRPVRLP